MYLIHLDCSNGQLCKTVITIYFYFVVRILVFRRPAGEFQLLIPTYASDTAEADTQNTAIRLRQRAREKRKNIDMCCTVHMMMSIRCTIRGRDNGTATRSEDGREIDYNNN